MQTEKPTGKGGWICLCAAIASAAYLVVASLWIVFSDPYGQMSMTGNDSIMRYLSVRDWLAGQSWFDMANYRVLPPEGLSLHWSRYVDLGIAAVAFVLGLFLDPGFALSWAAMLWPVLLQVVFITLTGAVSWRIAGPWAAAFAIFGCVFWAVISRNYFGPTQLDHHGLQILLFSCVAFTLVPTSRPKLMGILGGIAAALSLAIGLENLLPIAVAGAILMVRTTMRPVRNADQLQYFSLTLLFFAIALFAGQKAQSEWSTMHCDELGPPMLGLVTIGAASALGSAWATRSAHSFLGALSSTVTISIFAIVAALLILRVCPNFPYGNLNTELRDMITLWINEARPALSFLLAGETAAFSLVLPALATCLITVIILGLKAQSGESFTVADRTAATLLIFALIGTAGAFSQIRLIVLAAPVIPFLMGYAMSALLVTKQTDARSRLKSVSLVLAVAFCLLPGQIYSSLAPAFRGQMSVAPEVAGLSNHPCRSNGALSSLASLPKGRILSPGHISLPILMVSDHDVLSAPYHRSPEALGNTIFPFIGNEETLRRALTTSEADYLVLCKGEEFGNGTSFADQLATGGSAEGLKLIPNVSDALVVFQVDI
ncbi:MAG: hypothetical protein JJ894_15775 [Dinoroseobacter sp.]|nr:hypothetical protein [Dinoroseobacter sp.]